VRNITFLVVTLAFAASAFGAPGAPGKPPKTPNIVFFVMDDVGIDQMKVFGYGGATPPRTPNIDAIAHAGVRFRNTWAMPECSPSRAAMFTGRWPLRTNVQAVISPTVLANAQVSPFEVTTPKVLKMRGASYQSAMFGKFHLAGPDNNPYGNGGPHSLGFDYFYGWIEGEPYPIDTYAGMVRPTGKTDGGAYACGYVRGPGPGVCRFANGSCLTSSGLQPGLSCVANGGIFDAGGRCDAPPAHDLDFSVANGYYVSPLVINQPDGTVQQVPLSDPRSRGYRTTLEVNAARDWIRSRAPDASWMASVTFSADHVPYQPAPPSLQRPDVPLITDDCASDAATRVLSNQTIEAMDQELGRLLVELGIAGRDANGDLTYDPAASNTMIVIVGDNGSYAPTVKAPFDPLASKGTSYQTGVWVPLIVAGPLVNQPDRDVRQMVNVADLFALFGEIAGVDVTKAVPASHTLDAKSMLPYLTNPSQPSIRASNFTQVGTSITANNVQPYPCVIQVEGAPVCVQLFPSQDVCKSQLGDWYGPGSANVEASCCDVQNGNYYSGALKMLPVASWAIRNDRFKLLQKQVADCTRPPDYPTKLQTEFYAIDEAAPFPRLDHSDGDTLANNLLPNGADPSTLGPIEKANFDGLSTKLAALFASEVACPGDGNLDKRVNGEDLVNWSYFRALSDGTSSWYDFAIDGLYDGLTDTQDVAVIRRNLGTDCLKGR
jgi:hypothetical protein